MTNHHAEDVHDPLHSIMRFVFVVPLALVLAFVALVALSWTGWGTETDPVDQLRRDAPDLVLAAVAGSSAAALAALAVGARRRVWFWGSAAVGVLPAAVMVSAYFVDAY